jgi:DNA-binding transcriptional regulator YiaG
MCFTIDVGEKKMYYQLWFGGFSANVPRQSQQFEFGSRRSKKMTSAVSKIIEDLRDRGGLKGTDVANIASVSPATVSRWTAGKALPHPKTQLVISDLRYVVDRLSEFYTPDETRLWLYSKHRLLNGERAIDLINQGEADKILAVIESLDEGSFT